MNNNYPAVPVLGQVSLPQLARTQGAPAGRLPQEGPVEHRHKPNQRRRSHDNAAGRYGDHNLASPATVTVRPAAG